MNNRPPPQNLDAEKYVLGSVLHRSELYATVASQLDADDFYALTHQTIWRVMGDVNKLGAEVDITTVGSELIRAGKIKDIGGAIYLSELIDSVATVVHLDHYLSIIKGLSRRRRAIHAAQLFVADAHDTSTDTDTCLAAAQSRISDACADVSVAGPEPLVDLVEPAYQDVRKPLEDADSVKTGIGSLDNILGGLWPGLLTVLAARPSMGKSCMALNIAANAGLAGRKVLLFSMEDTKRFVLWRWMARFGGVPLERLVRHSLNADDHSRLDGAKEIIGCLPIHVDDRCGMTPAQVRHTSTAHKSRHGLDLLIIDLLGGLKASGNGIYEKTTAAVQEIAAIPRELNVACILVHQLNRRVEDTQNKIPSLSHLRESGEVEQLARVVMFLLRPAYYTEAYPEASENDLNVYITKNSHGPTGMVPLWCDMKHMTIQDGVRHDETDDLRYG